MDDNAAMDRAGHDSPGADDAPGRPADGADRAADAQPGSAALGEYRIDPAASQVSGTREDLIQLVTDWLHAALVRFMPDDDIGFGVSFYPTPAPDEDWFPALATMIVLRPIGEVEGASSIELLSPFVLEQATVTGLVERFAERTIALREDLRRARQGTSTHAGQTLPSDQIKG